MTDQTITDLRRRMLQDMTNRNFVDKTKHDYIRHVEALAEFLGRSPDRVTGDDLRRFQAAQIAEGAQPPKMNTLASALRFFLTVTLGRADLADCELLSVYGVWCPDRKLPARWLYHWRATNDDGCRGFHVER